MNTRPVVFRSIALILLFGGIGLSMFSESVRAVQIVGLLGCGAVIGSAFTSIIHAVRSKQIKE